MVFLYHTSDFTYFHMNEPLMTTEMLEAMHEFEKIAEQHGVKIQPYHCDNGCFSDHVL